MLSISAQVVPYPHVGSFQSKVVEETTSFLFKELFVRFAFGFSALSFSHSYTRYFSLRLITSLLLPSIGTLYSMVGTHRLSNRKAIVLAFLHTLAISLIAYKITSIYSRRILSSPPPLHKVLVIDTILLHLIGAILPLSIRRIAPLLALQYLAAAFMNQRLSSTPSPPPAPLPSISHKTLMLGGQAVAAFINNRLKSIPPPPPPPAPSPSIFRKSLTLVSRAVVVDIATTYILGLAAILDRIWPWNTPTRPAYTTYATNPPPPIPAAQNPPLRQDPPPPPPPQQPPRLQTNMPYMLLTSLMPSSRLPYIWTDDLPDVK